MKTRLSARSERVLVSTLLTAFSVSAVACGSSNGGGGSGGTGGTVVRLDTGAGGSGGSPGSDGSAVTPDGSSPDGGAAGGATGDGGATLNLNLYVGCANLTGDIQYYSFGGSSTGVALALKGTASAGSPVSFSVRHPTKPLLYVNHRAEGKISTFSIKADGTLALLGSIPVPYNVGQPLPAPPDAGGGDAGSSDAAPAVVPSTNPSTQTLDVDHTGKWLLAPNYNASTVLVFGLDASGTVGSPVVSWQSTGTTAHHTLISPNNKLVMTPYLMSHFIALYNFNDTTGALTPYNTPTVMVPGMTPGPRHLTLHSNGKWLYVINETNGSVTLFNFDEVAGTLAPVESYPAIQASYTGAVKFSAEVAIAPNGKFLYVSNRLDSKVEGSLGVFSISPTDGKLTNVEFQSSRGLVPRHFVLSPDGGFLVVGNQGSDNVVVFSINATSGRLEYQKTRDVCNTPFFVRFLAP
jgi:6-phosphogluconolactonase